MFSVFPESFWLSSINVKSHLAKMSCLTLTWCFHLASEKLSNRILGRWVRLTMSYHKVFPPIKLPTKTLYSSLSLQLSHLFERLFQSVSLAHFWFKICDKMQGDGPQMPKLWPLLSDWWVHSEFCVCVWVFALTHMQDWEQSSRK